MEDRREHKEKVAKRFTTITLMVTFTFAVGTRSFMSAVTQPSPKCYTLVALRRAKFVANRAVACYNRLTKI